MDRDPELRAPAELHSRQQVLVERVHAAGSDQPHHVQRTVVATDVLDQLGQRGNAKELSRLNGLGNANDILRNHATRAEIEMADFAVAHLSFWKANGQP